ncbi:hypothetical protein ST47_g2606 [Ascochyta rabiei]|uniref:Uncharacterized protein n=1 Tax=Didymella rabiei TaxID=5454 RepID=A0A163JDP7_DIDRA|nr:hypothetical protein ST47_g2606 [Ascochyta rabiei]
MSARPGPPRDRPAPQRHAEQSRVGLHRTSSLDKIGMFELDDALAAVETWQWDERDREVQFHQAQIALDAWVRARGVPE